MRTALSRAGRDPRHARGRGGAAGLTGPGRTAVPRWTDEELWAERAARYAEILEADALVIALPSPGGLAVFGACGLAGRIGARLRGLLLGALGGPSAAVPLDLEERLDDGRTARSVLVRSIVWRGRTIGSVAALRVTPWPVAGGTPIDAVARLAGLDLYQSYRELRGATAADEGPRARTPPPAPVPRRRPLGTALLATAVAQLLGADAGLTFLGATGPAAFDAAALASVLAAVVQVLALAALRGGRALRALLVALLITFVAAGMGVLVAREMPVLLAVRAAAALLALLAAFLAARALRTRSERGGAVPGSDRRLTGRSAP